MPDLEPRLTAPSLAVVTPTLNRRDLLQRLYESLLDQTDRDFAWIVVDDGGSDATQDWLSEVAHVSPFPVVLHANPETVGKCASLNRAFDAIRSDVYMVVDSDDTLLPHATATVKEKLEAAGRMGDVGALFFSYRDSNGDPLGLPPGGSDVVMSRAEIDATYGKYDGCVAYTQSMLSRFRYPEFPGERYLGPTVLQLMMSPSFEMLFCAEIVGVAEYQSDGLSRSGRALRLQNPKGMMLYSRLCAERGTTWRQRAKYRVSYWAYARALAAPLTETEREELRPPRGATWERSVGRFLLRVWRREVST